MSERHPVEGLAQILREDKNYVAHFLDAFLALAPAHQHGVLEYLVDQVPNERWARRINDPYTYTEVVKSMLFYWSGREGIKSEPSKEDLAKLLDDYTDSKAFLNAEAEKHASADKPSFTESLGEIRT